MKTKTVNRYNVPSDWKVDNLGNITNNFDSKRVPLSTMERSKKKGPFPYYGAAKIIDYIDDYIFDGEYCLIAEDGSVIKKDKTPFLQLLNGKFWPNNHTHVISAKHPLNNKYLFYYLSGIDISPFITGAAQPKINQKNLNKIPIVIPPKNIMNKIASILSNYDKLIENNTRRIEILEEMAQRIYKEWFIDFKYPGHENDELEDSELGMIPQDWQILEYDSITNIISRGPSIKYVNEDSGIPVLNQKCVRNGEIELDAIKYGSPLNTNKEHCYLQLNDILINSMGVGTLGRISRNLSIKSKMIIHNCITFVRADESKVKQSFLYYSLKRNQIYFEQLGIGATGLTSLKFDIIKGKEVIVPKQNLLNEFDKLVNPILKEIRFLKNKNHILQQTRDHLLPKLISGKVDVSDLDIDTSILDE